MWISNFETKFNGGLELKKFKGGLQMLIWSIKTNSNCRLQNWIQNIVKDYEYGLQMWISNI